jgi:hypothetical protein
MNDCIEPYGVDILPAIVLDAIVLDIEHGKSYGKLVSKPFTRWRFGFVFRTKVARFAGGSIGESGQSREPSGEGERILPSPESSQNSLTDPPAK